MSIRKLIATVLAFVVLPAIATAAVPAAAGADISGNCKASFDTSIGHMDYSYTFAVKDGKLTGKAKNADSESPLANGKVEGDKVTFVETFNYQGNPVQITCTGKVVSADEIQFSRDVMGMTQEELVARRVK